MGAIVPNGGPIPLVELEVVRRYPVLYVEKTGDGHRHTRNQRGEDNAQARYVKQLEEEAMARQRQFEKERHARRSTGANLEDESSQDCSNAGFGFGMDSFGAVRRDVTPYFQVRVRDVSRRGAAWSQKKIAKGEECDRSYMISIWRPGPDLLTSLQEGSRWKVLGLSAQGIDFGGVTLKLTNSKKTMFMPIPTKGAVQPASSGVDFHSISPSTLTPVRRPHPIPQLSHLCCGDEFDLSAVLLFEQMVSDLGVPCRKLVFADSGPCALVVEVCESDDLLFFTGPLKDGHIWNALNLKYVRFDQQLNVHVARATNHSCFISRPGRRLHRFCGYAALFEKWKSTRFASTHLGLLKKRMTRLINGESVNDDDILGEEGFIEVLGRFDNPDADSLSFSIPPKPILSLLGKSSPLSADSHPTTMCVSFSDDQQKRKVALPEPVMVQLLKQVLTKVSSSSCPYFMVFFICCGCSPLEVFVFAACYLLTFFGLVVIHLHLRLIISIRTSPSVFYQTNPAHAWVMSN